MAVDGRVVDAVEASDGVEIYVERTPGAGAGGETIVFSCAYSTTHENWRSQVAPLVASGHTVALWDFRGHGKSGVPQDSAAYSMAQVVDDLGRVLDWAAPGEPVVLAGLSFGGLASLHFTVQNPARVRALVLAGSGPGFKNKDAAERWRQRSERTASYIETRGLEAFVTGKAAPTCIGNRPELPAARAAAAAIKEQNPFGLGHFGRHVAGLAPSVIDQLAGIEQPALVVIGAEDAGFLRAAEVMASKLPQSRHECIEGAGHIVNIEATDRFNALVEQFLAQLSGG